VPYTFVPDPNSIDEIRSGICLFDELWLYCIHPDTFIHEGDNIVRASEFNSKYTDSFVFDKEKSLASDGFRKSDVFGHYHTPSEKKELYKISTRNRNIITSGEHIFYTLTSERNFWCYMKHPKNREYYPKSHNAFTEKPAKELRKGDRVLMAYRLPEPQKELLESELAGLVGYVTGDGTINHPHRSLIHIDDRDKPNLLAYKKMLEKFGFSFSFFKHKNSNCWRMRIFGKEKILPILEKIRDASHETTGKTTKITKVPVCIKSSNNKVLGSYLRGIFDAEGSIRMDKSLQKPTLRIQILMTNKKLMEELKYLLLRFGIESSRLFETHSHAPSGTPVTAYTFFIKDVLSLNNFKNEIGFLAPAKRKKLSLIPKYKTKRHIIGSKEIGFITSIEKIKADTDYMFDMRVPKEQNYIANGFVVHNCDSRLSSSGRNKFVTKVLLKSRKRDLDILYTTQSLGQVDTRIRRISDFICIPSFNEATGKCIARIYTHPSGYLLKVLKFDGRKIFPLYDTSEEIELPPDEPEKPKKKKEE
jgi:intein/homing endonuclease